MVFHHFQSLEKRLLKHFKSFLNFFRMQNYAFTEELCASRFLTQKVCFLLRGVCVVTHASFLAKSCCMERYKEENSSVALAFSERCPTFKGVISRESRTASTKRERNAPIPLLVAFNISRLGQKASMGDYRNPPEQERARNLKVIARPGSVKNNIEKHSFGHTFAHFN